MPEERLTEDLLARLLSSEGIEDYLDQGKSWTAGSLTICSDCLPNVA